MKQLFSLLFFAFFLFSFSSDSSISNDEDFLEEDCRRIFFLEKIPVSIKVFSSCDKKLPKIESLSKAVTIFVNEYSEAFDKDRETVWAHLHGLNLELSTLPRMVDAAYSLDGKYLSGKVPVVGLALSPKHIWLEVKNSNVWSSVFTHELIHITIWNENFGIHGDPDHEGSTFSGWTSKHTQMMKKIDGILFDSKI